MRSYGVLFLSILITIGSCLADEEGWEYWISDNPGLMFQTLEEAEQALHAKSELHSVLEVFEVQEISETQKAFRYRAPHVDSVPMETFQAVANDYWPVFGNSIIVGWFLSHAEALAAIRNFLEENYNPYGWNGKTPMELITQKPFDGFQFWYYGMKTSVEPEPAPNSRFLLSCNNVIPGQPVAYISPYRVQVYSSGYRFLPPNFPDEETVSLEGLCHTSMVKIGTSKLSKIRIT